MDGLFHGKSRPKMDEEQGYPHLWKPSCGKTMGTLWETSEFMETMVETTVETRGNLQETIDSSMKFLTVSGTGIGFPSNQSNDHLGKYGRGTQLSMGHFFLKSHGGSTHEIGLMSPGTWMIWGTLILGNLQLEVGLQKPL